MDGRDGPQRRTPATGCGACASGASYREPWPREASGGRERSLGRQAAGSRPVAGDRHRDPLSGRWTGVGRRPAEAGGRHGRGALSRRRGPRREAGPRLHPMPGWRAGPFQVAALRAGRAVRAGPPAGNGPSAGGCPARRSRPPAADRIGPPVGAGPADPARLRRTTVRKGGSGAAGRVASREVRRRRSVPPPAGTAQTGVRGATGGGRTAGPAGNLWSGTAGGPVMVECGRLTRRRTCPPAPDARDPRRPTRSGRVGSGRRSG